MALTAEAIYGFVNSMLFKHLDDASATPNFHINLWEMCTSEDKHVVIAAPRGHAKSTAISLAYVLASVLFGESKYVVLVSDTEQQAINFINNIKYILREDEDIQRLFGFKKFVKDRESGIIGEFEDGEQFNIIAKGAEQKLRGLLWKNRRPDLIIGDDLENDEVVLNQERRNKFKQWFFGALVPAKSKSGKIRIIGTVLHMDSLLENLLNDDTWTSYRFKAHNEDFSHILWPERFSKEELLLIRKGYINQGFPEGYSQEYLNYPIDEENAYFKKDELLDIEDWEQPLEYYAAIDFAISQASGADYTVIAVVGVDYKSTLKVIDIKRGRWDSLEIINKMFETQTEYSPEIFTSEKGAIERALGPFLYSEMGKPGRPFININKMTPDKDKPSRARSFQARVKSSKVEFDKSAPWWPNLEAEMLRFPKAKHDDQVDALSWIGLTLDKLIEAPSLEEREEEEWEEEMNKFMMGTGRSDVTGY